MVIAVEGSLTTVSLEATADAEAQRLLDPDECDTFAHAEAMMLRWGELAARLEQRDKGSPVAPPVVGELAVGEE